MQAGLVQCRRTEYKPRVIGVRGDEGVGGVLDGSAEVSLHSAAEASIHIRTAMVGDASEPPDRLVPKGPYA